MATPQPPLIDPENSEMYAQLLSHLRNAYEYTLNEYGTRLYVINNIKSVYTDVIEPLYGVKEILYGNNGETKEFVRVVKETAVGSGIFAGTKYALTGISLPALSALAIPAFGIAGGKLLYDAAPDFWNARAEELKSFGLMIGDFVMGLFDGEEEETVLPEQVIVSIRDQINKVELKYDSSLPSFNINIDKNNSYKYSWYVSSSWFIPKIYILPKNTDYIANFTFDRKVNSKIHHYTYEYYCKSENSDTAIIFFKVPFYNGMGINQISVSFNKNEPVKLICKYKGTYKINNDSYNHTAENINKNYVSDFSLWIRDYKSIPAHRLYVTGYENFVNPVFYENYGDYTNFTINSNFFNSISDIEFYDGGTIQSIRNFIGDDPSYARWNTILGYFMDSAVIGSDYEFSEGVVKPNDQTLTENYPEWKTNALDAVNSALQKGYAIGINPITNPALSPLEQQQQQQNPSPMSPSTITPEQWEQLIKIITQTITETVTTPNPNPNPDTQPQPNPQPLPDPLPDAVGEPVEIPDPNKPVEPGDIPILPLLPPSMRSNALFTVYNPSISQLNALGSFLWSIWNGTNPIENIIDIFKKIWQNPLDGVISLTRVYSHIPQGSTHSIYLGAIDSGVDAPVVSSQFVTQNMGSVPIAEILKNVTDYSPYCSINVYLPFIGYIEVDSDDFMDGSMNIEYTIDIWTGACLATIYSTRNPDMPSKTPLYTFSGNVCQQIPLTSVSANGIMSGLVSATAGLLTGASGGALATLAANTVSHQLVHVSRSGSISGNSGIMGSKTPGVVISRRNSYNANAYNTLYGFPSNKTVYLKNCKGFTKVRSIHLKSYASSAEKEEIVELLKKGVII